MIAPTPNPQNLYLGAGEVWLDRFDPVTFLPTGAYRHLGDVDSLEINTVVKALEKKSSMDGARATYANVVVSADVDVTLKLAELDPDNFALAMLGENALGPRPWTPRSRRVSSTAAMRLSWTAGMTPASSTLTSRM